MLTPLRFDYQLFFIILYIKLSEMFKFTVAQQLTIRLTDHFLSFKLSFKDNRQKTEQGLKIVIKYRCTIVQLGFALCSMIFVFIFGRFIQILSSYGTNYFYYCSKNAMNRMLTSYSLPKHNYQMPLSKRFPEDIQCIIFSKNTEHGSLYISNIQAAENPQTLKKFGIRAILSCARGYQLKHDKVNVPYYKYIPAIDHQTCDISPHFDQAIDFIINNLKKTNVLVHCIAGVSRSVSMVIAYLIKQQKMTFQEAYKYVKSRRNIINPNDGFIRQLKVYHTIVSKRNTVQSKASSLQLISNQQPRFSPYQKSDEKTAASRRYQQMEEIMKKQRNKFNPRKYEQQYTQFHRTSTRFQPMPNRYGRENAQISHSQAKIKHTQEEPFANRYYSPNKIMNREQPTEMKKIYTYDRSYYKNLNTDLDQKIEQIKLKYDSHKRQLQEKYQNIPSTGYKQNLKNNTYQPSEMYGTRKIPSYTLKTETYERYPQAVHFITPTKYNTATTNNFDKLFPREFYSNNTKKQIQRYNYNHNDKGYIGRLNNSIYRQEQSPKFNNKYDMSKTLNGHYTKNIIEHPLGYRKYY